MDKKRRDKYIIFTSLILTIIFVFSVFSVESVSGKEALVENCGILPATELYCLFGDVYGKDYHCETTDCIVNSQDLLNLADDCDDNIGPTGPCYQAIGGVAHCLTCTQADNSCGYGTSCTDCTTWDPSSLACLGNNLRGFYYKCGNAGICVPRDVRWNLPNSAPCPNGCSTSGTPHCITCAQSDTSCGDSCANCEDRSIYPRINFVCGLDGNAVYGLGWHCGGANGCAHDTFVEWDHDCPGGCAGGVCKPCPASGSKCGFPGYPPCEDCCSGTYYCAFLRNCCS